MLTEIPTGHPSRTVYAKGSATTTSTTRTKILEYIVTTGKDFYIVAYSCTKKTGNTTGAEPCTLEIESSGPTFTVFDAGNITDGSADVLMTWQESLGVAVKIATSGQKVQIYVAAGRNTSTSWFAKIIGLER